MATVKIDPDDDELLEILRAKMILRGKKKTKKEILGELIRNASENEEILTNDIMDQTIPLEKDPMWKILNNPSELDMNDTSENIDDYIYK